MQRILAQCNKELVQFKRDRLTLGLAFILPLISLFIFGFAIRLEAQNIPLYIQDFAQTPLSNSYVESLLADDKFETPSPSQLLFLQNQLSQINSYQEIIDQGIAKVVVVIPPEFSRNINSNNNSNIQVIVDASDVNNARIINNTIKRITTNFLEQSGLTRSATKIIPQIRIWFNPDRQEALYLIPGVYGVILWLYPSLLTAIAVAKEKEEGTMLKIYTSDISATEFLLGKWLAYLIIGMGQASLIMVIGALIWNLNLVVEPTSLFIGTLIFLANSVGLGLMIGVKSDNQIGAIQAVNPIVLITAYAFSGFIYPLSNLPFPLSIIPNFVPLRYYITITRDAYVRGIGWSDVWFSIIMLIVLGILIFNNARNNLKQMQLLD
ncbi:MAG: ABC transporter permease [Xenococcus sp. MO_188.B8]|nr:ABC transporter permease [Xenococcus sp. MO_188.B8]